MEWLILLQFHDGLLLGKLFLLRHLHQLQESFRLALRPLAVLFEFLDFALLVGQLFGHLSTTAGLLSGSWWPALLLLFEPLLELVQHFFPLFGLPFRFLDGSLSFLDLFGPLVAVPPQLLQLFPLLVNLFPQFSRFLSVAPRRFLQFQLRAQT